MKHDLRNDETCKIPGKIHEDSPQIFTYIDEVDDGMDTNHYMEPDAEAKSEQLSPTYVNPRSTTYDLGHNPKPPCNDDYRILNYNSVAVWYPEQQRTPDVDFGKVLRNAYGALT